MKNLFILIIKVIQWIIAGILLFLAYGGLQGDDILIPLILLVVAVFISPPVIYILFGRRKNRSVPGR
ncbi:MAG: hypothetical protein R6U58_01375 [Bacteroidales bacterium]